MQRFSSFRDFDWPLLSMIGLLSLFSVLEIKSDTLHTKFHGFDHKQILFLLAGLLLGMFPPGPHTEQVQRVLPNDRFQTH